jgi:phosphoglucosamine mutase
VAFITRSCEADAGIVISASHNPFEHNGIKIFNGEGFKLSDSIEERIEAIIDSPDKISLKTDGEIGHVVRRGHEFVDRYIDHVASCAEETIKDLKVIIDCSNGAASRTVNHIFSRFPIQLELIKDHPDGVNINDNCGSTHLDLLSRMVVAGGYDLGIAFDGDADRCLAVDELGNQVDGDMIMAVCGSYMKQKGELKNNTIVATVMSNLGFHEYCTNNGISVECTNVGDRYVLERMLEGGFNLGGEQSGHMIFLDDTSTGDGQLAAVKLLSVICGRGKKLSELVSEIKQYPQVLINVPISGGNPVKEALMKDAEIQAKIAEEQEKLGDTGRILVRPSGTEALIRVMVEAFSEEDSVAIGDKLANLIRLREKFLKI